MKKQAFRISLAIMLIAALVILALVVYDRAIQGVASTTILLNNVAAASTAYYGFYGTWPESLSDLTMNKSNVLFIDWSKAGTNDAWGHPVSYHPFDSKAGRGSVISYGRDGRKGGVGVDADIEIPFGAK